MVCMLCVVCGVSFCVFHVCCVVFGLFMFEFVIERVISVVLF